MEEELWKPILASRNCPDYEISNTGKVKNIVTGKIINGTRNSRGYVSIEMKDVDRKRHRAMLHTLVAEMFQLNDSPATKMIVDHINRIRTDNNAANLRWATIKENSNNCCKKKRGAVRPVSQYTIANELIKTFLSIDIAAEALKIDASNISRACSGKLKTASGFIWRYADTEHIENEIWKIVNLDGRIIEVSSLGRIKIGDRITKGNKSKDDVYYRITLRINGRDKKFSVHLLILQGFYPLNDYKNLVGDHIDQNPENNAITNLEWISPHENTKRGCGIKVTKENEISKDKTLFLTLTDGANDCGLAYHEFRAKIFKGPLKINDFTYSLTDYYLT